MPVFPKLLRSRVQNDEPALSPPGLHFSTGFQIPEAFWDIKRQHDGMERIQALGSEIPEVEFWLYLLAG